MPSNRSNPHFIVIEKHFFSFKDSGSEYSICPISGRVESAKLSDRETYMIILSERKQKKKEKKKRELERKGEELRRRRGMGEVETIKEDGDKKAREK